MRDIKTYIIALLTVVIILLLFKQCGNEPTITVDSILPPDTFVKIIDKTKPRAVDSVLVPFPVFVSDSDSVKFIKEFLTMMMVKRFYSDTAENDDMILVIQDSTMGIKTWMTATYKLKIPREIRTTYEVAMQPRFALYSGGMINFKEDKLGFGPMIGIRFREAYLSYSRDFMNQSNTINLGIEIKLKSKKKRKYLFF